MNIFRENIDIRIKYFNIPYNDIIWENLNLMIKHLNLMKISAGWKWYCEWNFFINEGYINIYEEKWNFND